VNRKLAGIAIILAAAMTAPCTAETAAKKKPAAAPAATAGGVTVTPSAPAAPVIAIAEEAQKVAEIQAILAVGECDKAIEAANAFLKTARDEGAKTETFRVLAEAYRKKGDWRQAAAAYQRLRDRLDKNSGEYAKYDGIAEILRGSPAGIYQPPGTAPAKPAAGGAQTLADDAVLGEALTRLAGLRGARMKARITTVTRGTTPQQVVAAFLLVAEEARQIYSISPEAPTDGPREVCVAAGSRLQTLGVSLVVSIRNKIEKLQPKLMSYGLITNVDIAESRSSQAACRDLVDTERKFQRALPTAGGKGDWPDLERLRKESNQRIADYEHLSSQFRISEYYY
jgi:tetratricopeptide (TPR) repeat protein